MLGYMRESQFQKLDTYDSNHPNLRVVNRHTMLKRFPEEHLPRIKDICGKKVSNLILPEKIYKISTPFETIHQYAYRQKMESEFTNLIDFYCYENYYSDEEILLFFKSILETIQNMHNKGIVSGDLHCGNILLDEELNHKIIDFDIDYATYLEEENPITLPLFLENYDLTFLRSNYSSQQQVELSDKMNLWNMFLHCMKYGWFSGFREHLTPIPSLKEFGFSESIEKQLESYMRCEKVPDKQDYLLDEIDTLIKKKYRLPYRKY